MRRKIVISVGVLILLCSSWGKAGNGNALYEEARKAYQAFWADESQKTSRANWLKVIAKFERVYQEDPNCRSASDAYFMAGKLSLYCYKYHRNAEDFERARRNFETFLRKYPSSSLADDTLYYLGDLYLKAGDKKLSAYYYKQVIVRYPNGDRARDARQRLEQMNLWPMPAWLRNFEPGSAVSASPPPATPTTPSQSSPTSSGRVLVKEIKYLSSGDYTRVIIVCKSKVKYTDITYISPNPSEKNAKPRLFLDILDARLAPGVGNPIPVNDGLLLQVRAGQFSANTVRVVLDVDKIDPDQTRVFPMEEAGGDFKIIIDVNAPKKKATRQHQGASAQPNTKTITRIILDPGHGGKDPGAIGPTGVKEKEVALKISLFAREFLQKKYRLDVKLTREKDVYLPLEERTAYANMLNLEDKTLFISLHTNAAETSDARGIETYILDSANNDCAKRLAAIENKVSIETIDAFQSDQGFIFMLFQKAKADESYNFALHVHRALINGVKRKFPDVSDHGVKEAPFFVLMGAKMPCILAELSFISNPEEEKRLASREYQELLAESLADGIYEYIQKKATLSSAIQ
jgi:N-acetylmuramoyl-L-alanine amidase